MIIKKLILRKMLIIEPHTAILLRTVIYEINEIKIPPGIVAESK
jgi:hypothetical protein